MITAAGKMATGDQARSGGSAGSSEPFNILLIWDFLCYLIDMCNNENSECAIVFWQHSS